MKKGLFTPLFLMVLAAATAQTTELKTAKDSASYAYGLIIAQSVQRQMTISLDYDLVAKAFQTFMKNEPTLLDAKNSQQAFTEYNRQQELKAGEGNRTAGQVFLENNKKKKGVQVTPSGLQFEIISKGAGAGDFPKPTDKVKVHYHGTLITGEVFDSSVDRGEPAVFGLNQVISGWTEGLQLMKPGDKFRFYLPYNLAYGERSAGPKIKPFSTLIFDVELMSIEK